MDNYLLLRYLHFLGLLIMFAALVGEHLLLKPFMTRREIGRMATLDAVYGLAALLVVGVGLGMWLGSVGKPSEFYTENHLFLTKVGLAGLAGLISLIPTFFFLRHRRGELSEKVFLPDYIRGLIRFQLVLYLLIPALAVLMAAGIHNPFAKG